MSPEQSEDARGFGFAVRMWNLCHWFRLSQEDFIRLLESNPRQQLASLLAIMDVLESRNPEEHNALVEGWALSHNALLLCAPAQAVKDGRLEEVLQAAREAVLIEAPQNC